MTTALRPFLPADAPALARLFRASVEILAEEDYTDDQRSAWAAASDDLAALPSLARQGLQLAGGDDYELCFSAPVAKASQVQSAAEACDVRVTRIGRVVEGAGIRVLGPGGQVLSLSEQGYRHFAS